MSVSPPAAIYAVIPSNSHDSDTRIRISKSSSPLNNNNNINAESFNSPTKSNSVSKSASGSASFTETTTLSIDDQSLAVTKTVFEILAVGTKCVMGALCESIATEAIQCKQCKQLCHLICEKEKRNLGADFKDELGKKLGTWICPICAHNRVCRGGCKTGGLCMAEAEIVKERVKALEVRVRQLNSSSAAEPVPPTPARELLSTIVSRAKARAPNSAAVQLFKNVDPDSSESDVTDSFVELLITASNASSAVTPSNATNSASQEIIKLQEELKLNKLQFEELNAKHLELIETLSKSADPDIKQIKTELAAARKKQAKAEAVLVAECKKRERAEEEVVAMRKAAELKAQTAEADATADTEQDGGNSSTSPIESEPIGKLKANKSNRKSTGKARKRKTTLAESDQDETEQEEEQALEDQTVDEDVITEEQQQLLTQELDKWMKTAGNPEKLLEKSMSDIIKFLDIELVKKPSRKNKTAAVKLSDCTNDDVRTAVESLCADKNIRFHWAALIDEDDFLVRHSQLLTLNDIKTEVDKIFIQWPKLKPEEKTLEYLLQFITTESSKYWAVNPTDKTICQSAPFKSLLIKSRFYLTSVNELSVILPEELEKKIKLFKSYIKKLDMTRILGLDTDGFDITVPTVEPKQLQALLQKYNTTPLQLQSLANRPLKDINIALMGELKCDEIPEKLLMEYMKTFTKLVPGWLIISKTGDIYENELRFYSEEKQLMQLIDLQMALKDYSDSNQPLYVWQQSARSKPFPFEPTLANLSSHIPWHSTLVDAGFHVQSNQVKRFASIEAQGTHKVAQFAKRNYLLPGMLHLNSIGIDQKSYMQSPEVCQQVLDQHTDHLFAASVVRGRYRKDVLEGALKTEADGEVLIDWLCRIWTAVLPLERATTGAAANLAIGRCVVGAVDSEHHTQLAIVDLVQRMNRSNSQSQAQLQITIDADADANPAAIIPLSVQTRAHAWICSREEHLIRGRLKVNQFHQGLTMRTFNQQLDDQAEYEVTNAWVARYVGNSDALDSGSKPKKPSGKSTANDFLWNLSELILDAEWGYPINEETVGSLATDIRLCANLTAHEWRSVLYADKRVWFKKAWKKWLGFNQAACDSSISNNKLSMKDIPAPLDLCTSNINLLLPPVQEDEDSAVVPDPKRQRR